MISAMPRKRRRRTLRQEFLHLPAEIATIRLGWKKVIIYGAVLGLLLIATQYGMQLALPQHIDLVQSWNLG